MIDPALLASTLRLLDGHLPPDELPLLARRLRVPGEDRRQVARLLLQMATLQELRLERGHTGPRLVVAPARPARSTRRWRTSAAIGAAVAAGLMLALLWPRRSPPEPVVAASEAQPVPHTAGRSAERERKWWPDPPAPGRPARPVASLVSASGTVRLIDDHPVALRAGTRVLSGQGIETVGAGARAALNVAGGARLELEGNTQLLAIADGVDGPGARDPDRVLLERGSLQVDLNSVTGNFSVVSPIVEVRARRSQFRMTATGGELRVWVNSGQVTLIRLPDRYTLTVEAGAAATMTESQALAIPPPPRPVALLVVGSRPVPRALETDSALQARLERLGYAVTRLLDGRLEKAALADKALVVLSPSTAAAVVRDRLPNSGLREAPLPIVNCEIEAMPSLGMATTTGMVRGRMRLTVQASAHPLAAGLAGNIRVTESPAPLMWAKPTSEATVIATLDGTSSPALFGYETGARMNGLSAPARRVSCFLSELATIQASEAGWQLFDSAVRWAGAVKR